MRTVSEHLAKVLARAGPLDPLDLTLLDSRGCLLAESVRAASHLPPFDSAAVEGYAVRCVDLLTAGPGSPIRLAVTDDVPPGYRASHELSAGTAIRVGSGALLPSGADAVLSAAHTDGGYPDVTVLRAPTVGENIRRAGEELRAGDDVLGVGTLIGAREVALLAAVGRARVLARPKPRVAVVSTGTELVEPGAVTTPGLIPDASGYLLAAAAMDAGAMSYRAGPVPDEDAALTLALEDQLVRADVIVTTGGVTPTTYSMMKAVLDRMGHVEFARVGMSPGMAQGFGRAGPDQIPIFTLPGAPVAAFISFEVFVRPVIRRMLGHEDILRPMIGAQLAEPVTGQPGLRTFIPALLEGDDAPLVRPVRATGLPGLRKADCLIVVAEDRGPLPAGARVGAVVLDGAP